MVLCATIAQFLRKRGFAMGCMRTRAFRTVAVLAVALASVGAAATTTVTGATVTGATGTTAARATADPVAYSLRMLPQIRPAAQQDIPYGQTPIADAQCEAELGVDCYLPTQVEAAYNLPQLYSRGITGKGETIVIVDAYGSPTISDDLAQFDDYLGLGSPSFQIVTYGNVPPFDNTNAGMLDWAGETSLDVEYAHAGAPGAKIVLVEAANASKLIGAVGYAVSHHLGDVISLSWSEAEPDLGSGLHQYDSVFAAAAKAHITIVACTSDEGASGIDDNGNYFKYPVVGWPASDPLVTAVGGTELNLNASGQRAGEDWAWNDTYNTKVQNAWYGNDGPSPLATGGGKSIEYGRPSYQNGVKSVTGSARGIPDISMSASESSSVNVYESWYGDLGAWTPTGGTSESTPMFAAVVALADQVAGHSLGLINPALYEMAARHDPGIVAVASGNNTVTFGSTTVHGYTVKNGYNLVTGLGTINGQYFVPELARLG